LESSVTPRETSFSVTSPVVEEGCAGASGIVGASGPEGSIIRSPLGRTAAASELSTFSDSPSALETAPAGVWETLNRSANAATFPALGGAAGREAEAVASSCARSAGAVPPGSGKRSGFLYFAAGLPARK
jgi:hypothetical protein